MALSTQVAQTSDFAGFLDPVRSKPIFEEVARRSVLQQLARKIDMGPTGVTVPYWDGEVTASWTAEGGKKPLTKGGFDMFGITPSKITTIFAMSSEVVRANPEGYIETMKEKVAEAFAVAFDNAGFHGTNTPFGAYIDQTAKAVDLSPAAVEGQPTPTTYDQLNNSLSLLVNDGKKLTGFLLDEKSEPIINGAVDKNGRPLFLDANYTETNDLMRRGRILSRPAMFASQVGTGTTLGYAGDWGKVLWGQIGGISYDVSDQATLTLDGELVSLWEHNLVAVRCEAEYALHVHDKDAFVKLTS
ncbi:major capsid protein [Rhodococcus phage BobbyDazzler]|uniref:Major capsid protein n=8 Tax=Rerduovirus TaxID=1982375 RepID=A0A222ZJE8_9CAUD|nr:major capsid protein [Rhodococcus phage Hiro]YP_009838157.1 major capsid protein [Rhodococcus phage Takoda]YP_010060224.1 major capsid protein [Rhodococcus phage PhailMary]AOT23583.1 major capsid protein [Rhodococcus phage Harlequin]AOZ62835.1 major capsid protein [Rhodococcus phage Partridge]AQP30874.1 major capsid protein [Rhodococcus phage AngryOrchard]AQP30939.1 major capsid protein [Rhodococcus phage BobbyDazzler]ASJ78815.1 major capsid protein [Rhodococcus phage Jester]ASR80791.1 m